MTDKIAIFSPTGEPVTEIESPGDHTLLAFNSDGSLLASSNSAGLIEVWKLENGKFNSLGSIRKDSVYSLAFNPFGTHLAIGATDAVYLFDPLMVNDVASIPHGGNVTGISYYSDGSIMATASQKTVQYWDMSKLMTIATDNLIASACSRLTANFSQAQWSNLFGSEPYRVLCENLPVP